MAKKDYSSEEFKRLVIMGESTVQGGPWLQRQDQRFADVVARLINECRQNPVEYFNEGVSASVISPRSSCYEASAKPSAIERYQERVIGRNPDLFIFCYGLNDMRAGTPLELFCEEMERIIAEAKAACDPVTVLTTVYHMTRYDWHAPFDVGGVEATIRYNAAIADLAARHGCILADVWAAEGLADWLIHPDGVHANAVGNLLIAHRVFEALAQNCSCLSAHTRAIDAGGEWTKRVTRQST